MKKRYVALAVFGAALAAIFGLWGYRDIPFETLRQKYANQDSRFLQIQGMPVHVRVEGNPSDSIPLLLIHGTGASLQTWDKWVDELKSKKRIIRLDLPAYGLTGPTADGIYSMDTYYRVLKEVLDSLNVKRVDVAGNSLGGHIAWYMTLNSPERVRKLILIDAAGYPNANNSKPLAFRLAEIPYLSKALTFITPRFVVRNSIKSLYADKSKVSEELITCYFELCLRAGNRQAFLDRWRTHLLDSSYQRIPTIHHQTLILWGSEDQFIPVDRAYEFHRDLANDTLIVLPNNGHMPMEESPQITAAIVWKFLSKN